MLRRLFILWKLLKPLVAFLVWLAGIAGATGSDWLRWFVMLMPWLTNPWVWVAAITLGVAIPTWDFASWVTERRLRGEAQKYPAEHETEAEKVLLYIQTESKWSEQQIRKLNFREMIDHLAEFRRAGLHEGLRMTGRPTNGGSVEPIHRLHWSEAAIHPEFAKSPGKVRTKSERNPYTNPPEYTQIAVLTTDWRRIWPKANATDRAITSVIIRTKKVYYANTRDAWAYRCMTWRQRWQKLRNKA